MLQIRPVSDLRNKFPDIEKIVNTGEPVYLTKNVYGAMVVLSLEFGADIYGTASFDSVVVSRPVQCFTVVISQKF